MDDLQLAILWVGGIILAGVLALAWLRLFQKDWWNSAVMVTAVSVGLALFALRTVAQNDAANVVEAALLSFLDALRYFTLDMPFSPYTGEALPFAASVYRFLEIGLSAVAPLCTAAVLLSILQIAGKMRRFIFFWRPVYYFSELNEKSFTLAKNIDEAWHQEGKLSRKPILIFCKVTSHDDGEELRFRNEARKLGAIFFRDPIYAIHKAGPWLREVKVFLIDTDENANMGSALKMKEWISAPGRLNFLPYYSDSDLLIFSTQESAEMLFSKLLENVKETRIKTLRVAAFFSFLKALLKPDDPKILKDAEDDVDKAHKAPMDPRERQKRIRRRYRERLLYELAAARFQKANSRIDLHLINETKLIAQNLLWEYPLFASAKPVADGKRQISLLIVGGGYMGMEILRTAMISSVMDECTFRARVVDCAADVIQEQFAHNYPYLPQHVRNAVTFHNADVTTAAFDRILKEHCRDSTYVVVATGDDERNMVTGQFLRRWFARQSIERGAAPRYTQQIYVAIRSSDRHESLVNLDGSGLKVFGCNTDVFCPEELLDRRMDRAGMMFNRCYQESRLLLNNLCPPSAAEMKRIRKESKRDYCRLDSVNQLSNQLVALHTLYKLQDLLYLEETEQAVRGFPKENTEAVFQKLIHQMKAHWNALCCLEHRRWEVFQAMDGWAPFPDYMIQRCAWAKDPGQSMHKHMAAKLHGCLTPYDKLMPLADTVNNTFDLKGDKKKEFLRFDSAMCVASLFAWLELVADREEADKIRHKILGPKERKDSEKNSADANAVLERLCGLFPQENNETAEEEPVKA